MRRIVLTAFILSFVLVTVPAFMPEPVCAAITGSGTSEDPYMIYNVDDLQAVGNGTYEVDAYYELANDIDASDTATWNWDAGRSVYEGFVPLPAFTGNFNGNYYTISGLYMNWYDDRCCVGLFSSLGNGATVRNACIMSANITNYYTHTSSAGTAGVLCGTIYSKHSITISRIIVSGTVDCSHDDPGTAGNVLAAAGGLVGYINDGHGTISECASYADVTFHGYNEAWSIAGGFIGHLYDDYPGYGSFTISNCYAMGDATAFGSYTKMSAGFVASYGTPTGDKHVIDDGYSTGDPTGGTTNGFVDSSDCTYITNCFWDKETSGTTVSDCGTGKTTAEMKTQSTFTDVGWDFNTIWGIGGGVAGTVNNGYPYHLWWYNPYEYPGDFTQVLWFQPNAIIEGTTLPDRMGNEDGIITWGANPAGITITHGGLIPEEEYDFVPIIPEGQDIIQPNPKTMVGDIDLEALRNNPLYPLVQVLSIDGFLNERLVWLGLAWLIVIISMLGVHLGFDTRKNTNKPQHFVLTTITGLGLTIMFYTMGIFPLWTIILMSFGLVGAIIWERQPVI